MHLAFSYVFYFASCVLLMVNICVINSTVVIITVEFE